MACEENQRLAPVCIAWNYVQTATLIIFADFDLFRSSLFNQKGRARPSIDFGAG
jgi:hypothetical protein